MQTKSKTKSKSKRAKSYPHEYLALVILLLLLGEGVLYTNTQPEDWRQSMSLFDLSGPVSETATDLQITFAPMVMAVEGINDFYQQAATAAMPLLDLSQTDNELGEVIFAINDFYEQASTQMAQLLDFSSATGQMGSVAGISIER